MVGSNHAPKAPECVVPLDVAVQVAGGHRGQHRLEGRIEVVDADGRHLLQVDGLQVPAAVRRHLAHGPHGGLLAQRPNVCTCGGHIEESTQDILRGILMNKNRTQN
jgi:hypothetical protein